MEIQQVRFYGERRFTKGRTNSDVGDGVESLLADLSASNVNAVGRHQLAIRSEIDGRHGVLAAIAATFGRCASDAEGPAKQRAGAADVSAQEQLPDAAAGDGFTTNLHLAVNLDMKAELASELSKLLDCTFRFVTKMKIRALVHLFGLEPIDDHLLNELSCSLP